jgi:outer membrane protein OmpA-like peptidoglycan-associated protein
MLNNKFTLLSFALLLALSGCGRQCNDCDPCSEVDVPMSDVQFHSMFDEGLEEFDVATEVEIDGVSCDLHDFAWVEDTENADGFKNVCFSFDGDDVREDQADALAHNINLAKSRLHDDSDYQATIVVEGHACHSAGRPAYNMAKSESRAKAVYERCVEAGIPADCIKVVGRGQEVPAIIDGVEVTGDRVAQAPNRRCEMRVIYA